jgi:hypothetical protein
VLRLYVSMHETARVHGGECPGHLHRVGNEVHDVRQALGDDRVHRSPGRQRQDECWHRLFNKIKGFGDRSALQPRKHRELVAQRRRLFRGRIARPWPFHHEVRVVAHSSRRKNASRSSEWSRFYAILMFCPVHGTFNGRRDYELNCRRRRSTA